MAGVTRRDWVLAALCWTDALRAQGLAYFDEATAREIEAIAETIIPGDQTPGGREAGVIRFIDRALAGYDADKRALYTDGLANAETRRAGMFPGSKAIAELTPAQRIELLKAIENTAFFRQVRQHTILGYFGHPKHGGNRDLAANKLLGIESGPHYQPPFGYYDREAAK